MKKTHNFKELRIWKMSMELVKEIYSLSKLFPKEELFCLTLQIRKSAISIPSNIAEGCGRGSSAQLIQFINYSRGSAYELETQLMVAKMLDYHSNSGHIEGLLEKVKVIQIMIDSFIKSLESKG